MTRPFPFAAATLLLGSGAWGATVDCTFEPDGQRLAFTCDPSQGNANSEATVKDGERVDSVLVPMGEGIVSFLDIPADGRILITTVQTADGKAVHSSHGATGGALVYSQVPGHCEETW